MLTMKAGVRTARRFVSLLKDNRHGFWIVGYMCFYLLGFYILEHAGHRHYHVIHSFLDDMIPFCEVFIIPYLLWFAYMAVGILWFIFCCRDRKEYYKLVSGLAIGMTVFLVVSCIFPNKQDLRPTEFTRRNIFILLTQMIYSTDTPTNILPSIHVFNSVVICHALNVSPQMRPHPAVRIGSTVLAGLIVLSTMFLKQHSVVDVSLGILMFYAVQMFCDRVFQDEPSVYGQRYVKRT